MTPNAQATLWIGAMRYYIGRQTYAVSDFCDALRAEWTTLPDAAKAILRQEIEDAFRIDDANRGRTDRTYSLKLGDDCDRAEWEKVRALWREARA